MLRALEGAAQIVQDNGQTAIGTEHMLLALIQDSRGIAAQALLRSGVDLRALSLSLEELLVSERYRGGENI
ncbi:Clp protease N-terminal domain-containing protein [Euzebya tangerina]|uniref:Clp protease N-terminal domain-containing protein n=1 Tax=Euzebya tangerina TaxID=591198 RepID=UPI0039C88B9E